jgi:hypothetical protein
VLFCKYSVEIPIQGEETNKLEFYFDFGIGSILVRSKKLDCDAVESCSYADKKVQNGVYRNTEYTYQTAYLYVTVNNLDPKDETPKTLKLYIRITEGLDQNIMGMNDINAVTNTMEHGHEMVADLKHQTLGIRSVAKSKGKYIFNFNPLDLDDSPKRYDFQVFIEGGERQMYLDTAFHYYSPTRAMSVYSDIKLCLHDSPTEIQYYFFRSDTNFEEDWSNFVDYVDQNNEGRKTFKFSIIPISSFKNVESDESYSFDFDMQLFDSYDGNPIKKDDVTMIKTCDVFVGEFFMSK